VIPQRASAGRQPATIRTPVASPSPIPTAPRAELIQGTGTAKRPSPTARSTSAEGRVEGTVPMVFSADETTDVGSDSATPVSDDHRSNETEFTGRIDWVQIDIDEAAEDVDHLISPEDRLRVAMARQ
jgi:hypothetical protein